MKSSNDANSAGKNMVEHFLFPNAIFITKSPARVQTILGSCVSVCLYDVVLHYGAVNHYMLPWWNGDGIPSPKYGDIAVTRLVQEMKELGCLKQNLVAKVFGGADQHQIGSQIYAIGARNIATAESILNKESINIIARSTGGGLGRKIVFDTGSNKVLMKYLATPDYERNKSVGN
jgi:chemotaxis protein CheD